MSLDVERRILQLIVALVALFSVFGAIMGIVHGPGWLDHGLDASVDLESHFHYLSGELLAVAIGLLTCIPYIQARGYRFRTLGLIVIAGGAARLFSLLQAGEPSTANMVALGVELIVMPLLLAWQAYLANRWRGMRMPLIN